MKTVNWMPNIIQLNVLMKENIGYFVLQIKLINAASVIELKFNNSNTNRQKGGKFRTLPQC
jgi:hypothetical protein